MIDLKLGEYAKTRLTYCSESGQFTWRDGRNKGKTAGTVHKNGYVYINLKNKPRLAHRLAFYFEWGYLPENVDHANGIRSDNRISNLRGATSANNSWNTRKIKTNTSGYKGVRWYKRHKKWTCGLWKNGVYKHGGYFNCITAAAFAYDKLNKEHHGVFGNTGEHSGY